MPKILSVTRSKNRVVQIQTNKMHDIFKLYPLWVPEYMEQPEKMVCFTINNLNFFYFLHNLLVNI